MNFNLFIDRIRVLGAILPMLGTFISQAEQLFPGGGFGADKLRVVREWIEAAATSVGAGTKLIEEIWPLLNSAISTAVAAAHLGGLFKKQPPAIPPPADIVAP